ncbi:TRAP transporter small permease [Halomonas sp. WWR20]
MQGLMTLSTRLAQVCRYFSGIALIGVLTVTVVDVVTRYLFRATSGASSFTVTGSVELVSYLMLFALLAAMAANVEKSQVVVEAFSHGLKESIKRRVAGFYLLAFMVLGFVLAWGLWEEGSSAAEFGEVTQDLGIPMGPIYQVAAVICVFLAVRCLIHAFLGMVYAVGGESADEL